MRAWTIHSWPDEIQDGRYSMARGWWFRFGTNGIGLAYKNVRTAGYRPLFSERFGFDRTVEIRLGPHMVKFLRRHRIKP